MIRTVAPGTVHGRVRAPPSKSYTHRALVAAFLAGRPAEIGSPLDSEDTRATARGLVALGAEIRPRRGCWTLRRTRGRPNRTVRIDCRESGTTLRLLTAVAALEDRPVRFSGRGRLPYRPMEALFEPLRTLGAEIRTERAGRVLPFTVRGPIHAGCVTVSARESSQPVSALLLALSSLKAPSEVRIEGEIVSEPYIHATVAWLRRGGQRLDVTPRRIGIPEGGGYRARRVRVPGDASSAAYLWAAAAVSKGRIAVEGIDLSWPQADLAILEVLRSMGVTVEIRSGAIIATGPVTHAIRVDLTGSPDLYPLVAVLAALVVDGSSQLEGAPQLKHKESDRLKETLRLVRALGAHARRKRDSLWVEGTAHARALLLDDLSDHRLVMSAAIAALAGSGPSRIGDARAVRKSFPSFWSTLRRIHGGIEMT